MEPTKVARALADIAVGGLPLPHDLVHVRLGAEDLVADDLRVVADV